MTRLHELLRGFAARVNDHPGLRGPLAGWSPEFHIETSDGAEAYEIRIRAGRVEAVQPSRGEPGDAALVLRGAADVLEPIFEGRLSPLGAYTDGRLEVYGSPKDQVKLDVIALVLWGA